MSTETIPGTTALGAVHLVVSDLDRALQYYVRGLGLTLRESGDATVSLGTASDDLLILHADPSAPRPRGACGLFHFAVLVPSRVDLSRELHHLIDARVRIDGAS